MANLLFRGRQTLISACLGPVILGVVMVVGTVLVLLASGTGEASAAGPDEAHVIVQFGDGNVIVRPISFTEPISGYEALQLTRLDIITKDFGPGLGISVCGIEGVGDSEANCFSSGFWSSYFWNGISWTAYLVGPSNSVINDGAMELWSWQEGFVPLDPLPSAPRMVAASDALEWLRSQQESDGGYGSPGSTADVLLAVGANQLDPSEWITGGNSLLDYWSDGNPNHAEDYADDSAGTAGKLIAAVAGAGEDPRNFAGQNLVNSHLTSQYDDVSGTFNAGTLGDNAAQIWGILGWRAAFTDTSPVPLTATHLLVSRTNSDGGWGWSSAFESDTNSTAVALQSLVAGGECLASLNLSIGLGYLKSAQNSDGGFSFFPGEESDTNSTALAVQALLAVGQDPTGPNWTTSSGNSPFSFLSGMQLPDGSFEWKSGLGSDLFSTRQAVPALLGKPFPLHLDPPDQHQCFASPSNFEAVWVPIILK